VCGIIGLIAREQPLLQPDEERMKRVLKKIAYRGPDGAGMWKSGKILLGHRRLSIIDLSPAGAQPYVDTERGLVITFNGEIYNYQDIRATLAAQGYTFRSQTDTEVILCAYDRYGLDFFSRLRGMYAFCLLDQKKNIAILARDPAGEKPLYYYLDSERLAFSSEIKALHAFPEIDLSIDADSVKSFFALQYVPGPHTIYRQVRKLPAGSALKIDLDQWNTHLIEHWSFQNNRRYLSTPEEIEELLSRSVRYRLIADVEVGLLLSGGIDSTLLAWYARQAGANLRVFSASFGRDDLDETRYARQVADHLGLQQLVVNGGQLDDDTFGRIVFHADEPLGDAACIPTYLLAREVCKHVKVVLSGEGADELFWGYDAYRFERLWREVSWVRGPLFGSSGFRNMVSKWEGSPRTPAILTRLAKILSAMYDLGPTRWTSVFSDHTIDRLVPAAGHEPSSYLKEMDVRLAELRLNLKSLAGSLSGDLLYWLTDDLLVKVDRMTMAHSVEARAPYLDPDLILGALSLSEKYKMNGREGKLLLRDIVQRSFPGEMGRSLARRKKHGFEVPVSEWLRVNLRDRAEEYLSPRKLSEVGLLDVTYVRQLWSSFLSSRNETPLRRKLWLILCLLSWFEWHKRHFGFSGEVA
jgi:asparagine synthase (glutamine-hydrolysing)